MKTFSFVLISTFFAILLAQDCNNPLLSVFNLTGLDTPQIGEGLNFCDNLQSGQTCCSAQTVQGFQGRLDNLTTSLQDLAGRRDVYLTELYANYSDQFQSAADDLTDFSDEIDRLQRDNATIGDEARAQYNALNPFTERVNRIANALDNIDDHFRSSVREYQQRRSACFNTVLQVQSSAWCLACDPNYANLGVQSDGSVNSSPEVCNAIQSSCALYTERADYFNPLWQAQQAYDRLVNLTNYLRDYKDNNYVIPENVTLENDIFAPTNDTERTSALPENCTQESCQWQCENFFSPSLVLNESIAANGGGILGGDDINFPPVGSNMPPVVNNTNDTVPAVNETVTDVNENVEQVTEVINEVTENVDQVTGTASGGRLLQELQENLWAPNLDGTGLNFNVVDDPADLAAIWANNPVFDDSDTNNPTDNTENTETDNDDDQTDNDGINTTENDNTDNDGFDTTNNTDNDGFDTTGNNDDTDNDGIDTTGNNDFTDNDGIDTTGDDTNNDNTNDDDTNPTNPTNPTNEDDDTDGN